MKKRFFLRRNEALCEEKVMSCDEKIFRWEMKVFFCKEFKTYDSGAVNKEIIRFLVFISSNFWQFLIYLMVES